MNIAYTVFWAAWILGGLGVELRALFNQKPGDTLSEQFWAYLTGQRHHKLTPAWAWTFRIIVIAGATWLGPHLAFGLWS